MAYTQINHLDNNLQIAISEIEKWASKPLILFGFDLSPRAIIQNFSASAGSYHYYPLFSIYQCNRSL